MEHLVTVWKYSPALYTRWGFCELCNGNVYLFPAVAWGYLIWRNSWIAACPIFTQIEKLFCTMWNIISVQEWLWRVKIPDHHECISHWLLDLLTTSERKQSEFSNFLVLSCCSYSLLALRGGDEIPERLGAGPCSSVVSSSALGAQVTPLRSLYPQFLPGKKKGWSKSFRYRSTCPNRVVKLCLRSPVPKPGQPSVHVLFQGLRPTSLSTRSQPEREWRTPGGGARFYPWVAIIRRSVPAELLPVFHPSLACSTLVSLSVIRLSLRNK